MTNVELDRHWAWTPSPKTTGIILCERTGRWARALRRELGDFDVSITETRGMSDCRQELTAAPASVVAIEASDASLNALLAFLIGQPQEFPQACVIALADGDQQHRQWLLRGAGAVHFVRSPRDMAPVVEIARRHLAPFLPQPSLVERILTEIDWGD